MEKKYWLEEIRCVKGEWKLGYYFPSISIVVGTYDSLEEAASALREVVENSEMDEELTRVGFIVHRTRPVSYKIKAEEADDEYCWSYDKDGNALAQESAEEYRDFDGRPSEECPFDIGDKVFVYDGGCVNMGIIKLIPPTPEEVMSYYKRDRGLDFHLDGNNDCFHVRYAEKGHRIDFVTVTQVFPMQTYVNKDKDLSIKRNEDKKEFWLSDIRSFVRQCNHWLMLLPDETEMFVEAAFKGSQMDENYCVEKLARVYSEECPHDLAMLLKQAYKGFYFNSDTCSRKEPRKCKLENIWNNFAKGHTFPKDSDIFTYVAFDFRAAIESHDDVDADTFAALCFGQFLAFYTDYGCVDDCGSERYYWEKHLSELSFEGLKAELREIEAMIKSIVGESSERYYWNRCRCRTRFDRELIGLFEQRKEVLNRMVFSTDEEKERFHAVDALLHELTKEMYRRTGNLYRSTKGNGDSAYDYEVEGWVSYYVDWDGENTVFIKEFDNDSAYGSDFKYMMMCAYQQQELDRRTPGASHIVSCLAENRDEFDATATDEQLGLVDMFDGKSWYITRYCEHPMSNTKICYAMHKLLKNSLLSIPDILRIESFEVEVNALSQYRKDVL